MENVTCTNGCEEAWFFETNERRPRIDNNGIWREDIIYTNLVELVGPALEL